MDGKVHAVVELLQLSGRRRSISWRDAMKASWTVGKTHGVAIAFSSVIPEPPERGAL